MARRKTICRKINNQVYGIGKTTTEELVLVRIPKNQSKKICKRIVK